MDIIRALYQFVVGVADVLVPLNEVRGVEHAVNAVNVVVDVDAVVYRRAVNRRLVLVAQHIAVGNLYEGTQSVDYLVAVLLIVLSAHEIAEHSDALRAENICERHKSIQHFFVLFARLGNIDFA